jgi:hypothetical protein
MFSGKSEKVLNERTYTPGAIFITLYFLCRVRMGPKKLVFAPGRILKHSLIFAIKTRSNPRVCHLKGASLG